MRALYLDMSKFNKNVYKGYLVIFGEYIVDSFSIFGITNQKGGKVCERIRKRKKDVQDNLF